MGLRPKSAKRVRDDVIRKKLRIAFLADHPTCEMCRQSPSVDVDEIIGRGVLPGAQLLPELFQALCRPCHHFKTIEPDWSYRHGYSAHVYDYDNIESIKARRTFCPPDCAINHIVG